MESPPSYAPPPKSTKKSNTGLIIGLVLGGIAICCIGGVGLLIGGGFWIFGKVKGQITCMMHFEEVRKAVDLYVKDHDGRLPKAENWQDEVKPYLAKVEMPGKDKTPFERLNPEGDWGCKQEDGGSTGMTFNSEVSGKKPADVKDPYSTILIFETEKIGKNLSGPYTPRDPANSPKILGEPRGWLEMPVIGKTRSTKKGETVEINFDK